MADADKPHFETDEVSASRAREQGLGVGERELQAQRDPGGDRTADEDEELTDGLSDIAGDPDDLNESVGVQGASNDDQQLSKNSDA